PGSALVAFVAAYVDVPLPQRSPPPARGGADRPPRRPRPGRRCLRSARLRAGGLLRQPVVAGHGGGRLPRTLLPRPPTRTAAVTPRRRGDRRGVRALGLTAPN